MLTFVPFQGDFHFNVAAVIGGQEIGTDQQQNDVGGAYAIVNLIAPLVAGLNAPVAPGFYQSIAHH